MLFLGRVSLEYRLIFFFLFVLLECEIGTWPGVSGDAERNAGSFHPALDTVHGRQVLGGWFGGSVTVCR